MKDLLRLASEPMILCSTRVRRTYTGGKMLEESMGYSNPIDSDRPEDWVASVVEARSPGKDSDLNECLSLVRISEKNPLSLKKIISLDPGLFLGAEHVHKFGESLAILVKFIDSAERLTIQVHPDKKFAKDVFSSEFGKAEAWYIIDTREIDGEKPYLLIGFKPWVTKEIWMDIFERQDIPEMINCLHKVYPTVGEGYMIEGGTPHAIGPGCYLIEIQEPTDYTLRTEMRTPQGEELPELLIHQGAGFQKLFECFHYKDEEFEQMRNRCCIAPATIGEQDGGVERALINACANGLFRMTEVEIAGRYVCSNDNAFSLLIVLSGEGFIEWDGGRYELNSASRMFIPFGLKEFTLSGKNESTAPLKAVRCFPPSSVKMQNTERSHNLAPL